ncbi:hypothetical protein IM697_37255 [Streptomyces ferrugineus]|uniref:Uncharacterized protein n=1 Tax=Streptomyces ferrugineus TaxID=1413221 RepID=A0A7M2SH32_9ACTN|nr:hypothetical protein [Streptomyces ferrugineus]QOV35646.1 hypothetical protein IM697_37255 [Streptomyces ferrugineus]
MKAFLLHLRASYIKWTLLALVVLDLAFLFLRTNFWIGIWPETGAAAQVPAFFLSILASGAAATASGFRATRNLEEQFSAASLSKSRIELHRLGALVAVFLAPYLIGHAVAFVMTARTFPPGAELWFGYVLMGASTIFLAAGWGWAIGKLLSPIMAALCSVLSWIIVVSTLGSSTDMIVTSGPPWRMVDLTSVSLRLLVATAFLFTITWLPSRINRTSLREPSLAITACAVVAVGATIVSTTAVVDRQAPTRLHCIDGAIEICLWPEHEKYIPIAKSTNERVASLPSGFKVPKRLSEYGTKKIISKGPTGTTVETGGDFDISEGSRWALALGIADAVTAETFQNCDWNKVRENEDYTADVINHWIETYLAGGGSPDYKIGAGAPPKLLEEFEEASRVANTLPEEKQLKWLEGKVNHMNQNYCG